MPEETYLLLLAKKPEDLDEVNALLEKRAKEGSLDSLRKLKWAYPNACELLNGEGDPARDNEVVKVCQAIPGALELWVCDMLVKDQRAVRTLLNMQFMMYGGRLRATSYKLDRSQPFLPYPPEKEPLQRFEFNL